MRLEVITEILHNTFDRRATGGAAAAEDVPGGGKAGQAAQAPTQSMGQKITCSQLQLEWMTTI